MRKKLFFITNKIKSKHALTLPARPSSTAATTVAQAPVPQARVAPADKQFGEKTTKNEFSHREV